MKYTCIASGNVCPFDLQVQAAGIDPASIRRLLVTHMHGDHCFGIPGLLAAIAAARAGGPLASETLLVVGPPGLSALLRSALTFGAGGANPNPNPTVMPVLVVELTADPAASHAPKALEGLGLGHRVRVARLGPDQAELANRAIRAAEVRGSAGGSGGRRSHRRDEHMVCIVGQRTVVSTSV